MPRTKTESVHREYQRDYTLKEWCDKRKISRAKFWQLVKKKLAPEVIQPEPGGRISITREADEAWARKMSRHLATGRIDSDR
jgi:hypothetical protein